MTNLVAAYQRNDILEFEKILKVRTLFFILCCSCEHDLFCQDDVVIKFER